MEPQIIQPQPVLPANGVFTKLKLILTRPTTFWNSIENEQGLGPVIKYIWSLIPIGIILFSTSYLISLKVGTFSPKALDFLTRLSVALSVPLAVAVFVFVILYFVLFFILSFVFVFFTHLGIRLSKGQGKFDKTYQAYVYGVTPQLLFSVIPIVSFVTPIWMVWLQLSGLSKLHKISIWRAVGASVFGYLLFFIVVIIIAGAVVFSLPHQQITLQTTEQGASVTGISGTAWTDPQGTFQTTIPSDWTLGSTPGAVLSLAAPNNSALLEVQEGTVAPGQTLNSFYDAAQKNGFKPLNIVFAGEPAVLTTTTQGNIQVQGLAFQHNGIAYTIQFSLDTSKSEENTDLQGYELFYNSFRFLK